MLTATGSPFSILRALPVMLAATATPCLAGHTAQPFLSLGDRIDVPRGFAEMCTTTKDFCSTTPASADTAIVTAALAAPQGALSSGAGFSTSALALGGMAIVSSAPNALSAAAAAGDCRHAPEISPSRVTSFFSFEDSADRYSDMTCAVLAEVVASPVPVAASLPPSTAVSLAPQASAKLLKRVNRYVNSRVQQRTDFQIYARDELWVRSGVGPQAMGDCEDIAIEKRYELINAGYPADRLTFAVVYSNASGLHTVLLAKTDDGDVVLDSRSPYIRPWSEVGYSWISVQTAADPMIWRRVV